MNGVNDLEADPPANRLSDYCEVKVGGVKDAIEGLARALPRRGGVWISSERDSRSTEIGHKTQLYSHEPGRRMVWRVAAGGGGDPVTGGSA